MLAAVAVIVFRCRRGNGVDPNAMVEQYNHQHQSNDDAQRCRETASKKTRQWAKMLEEQQKVVIAAAAEAKKKAAAAKQFAEVDDLFDGLPDSKNSPEGGVNKRGTAQSLRGWQGNAKAAGASGANIKGYMGQIQSAIQSKFYDPGSFTGKTCDLHIKLAQIPKSPSDAVYQHFKNFTLGFKPQ